MCKTIASDRQVRQLLVEYHEYDSLSFEHDAHVLWERENGKFMEGICLDIGDSLPIGV